MLLFYTLKIIDIHLTAYLAVHAILALLIDVQSIAPPALYALYEQAGLTAVVAQWVRQEGDFLVGENPLWFRLIVGGEIMLQVPTCFALAYGFATAKQWVRLPSLMYSTHVLTTMIPIMGVLCSDPRPTDKCKLVYAFWVMMPAALLLRCLPWARGFPSFASAQIAPVFAARPRTLWKIALRKEVEAWEAAGVLQGSALDASDGFIHTSDSRMVRFVLERFFHRQDKVVLLQIEPSSLPPGCRWVRAEDATEAALAEACKGDGTLSLQGPPPPPPPPTDPVPKPPLPPPLWRRADSVRVLPDGCAHLHVVAPLPMAAVRIHALELHSDVHYFPAAVATQIPGALTIPGA